MIRMSRRTFVACAAVIPFGAASVPAYGLPQPLLLYDRSLEAGSRFAACADALGRPATGLDGDRVRQIRQLLSSRPPALFGVTRRSDEFLIAEIAGEEGYRRVALVQHRADGTLMSHCTRQGEPIARIAPLAGSGWPEAFAELALGRPRACNSLPMAGGTGQGAMSWALVKIV